ncbi:KNOX meinox protein [Trifolium repens]|nr:KNOX meinox protein [Trifolium repens]
MEGKEIGGRNVEGINVGKKNENENDEEILKKIIASHPLFEVMIESHINCLKVGSEDGGIDIISDAWKKLVNTKSKAAISPNTSELDHFMDLGVNKTTGSKNGIGDSEYDSASRFGGDRSVVGLEEGWSEKQSEGEDSVNDEEDGGMDINDTTCNNCRVIAKGVCTVTQDDREILFQDEIEKGTAKGKGSELVDCDGDKEGTIEADCGSVASVVIETPQNMVDFLDLCNQHTSAKVGEVVGDRDVVEACVEGEKEGDGPTLCVVENGPNLIVGPLDGGCEWGQRKGKEVVIWEDNNKKIILNGSTSIWASRSVGLGQFSTNNENCQAQKLIAAKNKQKKKKGKGGKKRKSGVLVTEDNNEDDIHSENSESMGDSCSETARQFIPVTNIQIVLNEGEVNRRGDVDVSRIRLEAERLFHIGLNLGITSNEERLGTLDRMVDLEVGDLKNFEEDGGEEEVR